jgi:hypothetical protein
MAGVDVRLEPDQLDVKGATAALLDGRGLWRVTTTSVTPATNVVLEALGRYGTTEGPHVCREHRCTAAGAPVAPFAGKESNPAPKEPQGATQPLAAPSTPSPGRPDRGSIAQNAARRRSEGLAGRQPTPSCSTCGQPVHDPATAVMFHLGATLIDAFHTDC